jgi:ribosome-associated protein
MEAKEIALLCAHFADEKKAKDIEVLELSGLTDISDYFLLATGTSERHVRTVAEHIEKEMKQKGVRPFSMEGHSEGRWVIIDYQSVVAHILLEPLRDLYDLESLWLEAKRYRIDNEKKNLGVGHGQTSD